jgi:hypothetical protein
VKKTRGHELRDEIRERIWPDQDAWTGEQELGFFQAPRTLPLILLLLSMKAVSGKRNPSRVYLELWARHMGGGVIEMKHEGEHAYAAGYTSNRGMRTWRDNMALLEATGFIKTKKAGNQQYKYVFLVHPTAVVETLKQQGKIDPHWLATYEIRQIETKERTFAERLKAKKAAAKAATKVVSMKTPKSGTKQASA